MPRLDAALLAREVLQWGRAPRSAEITMPLAQLAPDPELHSRAPRSAEICARQLATRRPCFRMGAALQERGDAQAEKIAAVGDGASLPRSEECGDSVARSATPSPSPCFIGPRPRSAEMARAGSARRQRLLSGRARGAREIKSTFRRWLRAILQLHGPRSEERGDARRRSRQQDERERASGCAPRARRSGRSTSHLRSGSRFHGRAPRSAD